MAPTKKKLQAKEKLQELKSDIDRTNPWNKIRRGIQSLSPSKDAKKIKYFKRISEEIMKSFQKNQDEIKIIKLKKTGPIGNGQIKDTEWHQLMKEYIDDPKKGTPEAKAVIGALEKRFNGIEFFQSEFPLYGYMAEDSEIFFWNGKVDAIGWYRGNYVIVEWKVVESLPRFWGKDSYEDAYGNCLHQSLVYAQLLKVHLNLKKLPYILIVPISSKYGKISPGLFFDFPSECKKEVDKYGWSTKEPKQQIITLSLDNARNQLEEAFQKDEKGQFVLQGRKDDLLKNLGFF